MICRATTRVVQDAGHPAFPVRLASEVFQRCMISREKFYKNSDPCILYDPCCGTAYHLSVLAYLHGENIRTVIGSDMDGKAVAVAKRNLELLTVAGLDQRIGEISQLFELYGKDSHKDALSSGHILRNRISALTQEHIPKETGREDGYLWAAFDGSEECLHHAQRDKDQQGGVHFGHHISDENDFLSRGELKGEENCAHAHQE